MNRIGRPTELQAELNRSNGVSILHHDTFELPPRRGVYGDHLNDLEAFVFDVGVVFGFEAAD
eukprot:CAMPEP_0203728192 /NCGR_PEP_ID=MMETSP0092-20131115/13117_1 /ASSEMBLY_ACC=CAM_ASM_001090 /TAXON_ID=426623 /ORGANISM="Chaetoceros affinis, Strain CCMP159" /LENGTH=61 /DNA_ID=CAMNT_0050610127 /DNA_START=73 /DNA_END=258 /DNA_ORIENTATION=+